MSSATGTGGDGSRHPSRSPTHKSLSHQKMMNLGLEVENAAEEAGQDDSITCDALEELALELGVDTSHLLASTAVTTEIQVVREHDVAFVGCGGICQNWGALECLETLVQLRRERLDRGEPGFDIQARSCLDKCEHAPAFVVHTPDGSAVMKDATPNMLRDAIQELIS